LRAGTLDKRSRTVDRDRDRSHPNVAEKPSENVSSGHLLQEDIQRRLRLCIAVSLLPLVLYWYETRSATLREEHRLRAFENGVPGKIFEPKEDDVAGGCIKPHNEELRDLYSALKYN
jgi:hypothetical protein